MRVGVVGALWAAALLCGCGTAPATGGAAVDAAASDAAGADGVAGDGASSSDAASNSDTATAADTAVDTAADASTGDAPSLGDAQASDGGDAKGDGGGSADAAPDGGAGDASGADGKDGGGSATGPYTCETACASIAKAACPADDPVATCVGECGQFTGEAPPECGATVQELLKCISTASITCQDGGKSDSSVCNYLEGQLEKCFSGGPPPNPDPCPAGNCYAGAGPNGVDSCGCDTNCYGIQVKLDCTAGKCSCTTNGKVTASFDDAAVCSMDPWETLKSACGLPTGP